MSMDIALFLCRSDNYGVLIRDKASGVVATIDAPDADAIQAALEERGWGLDHILITHMHFDHIEGIPALVQRYGAKLTAPALAMAEAPGAMRYVAEGDAVTIGALTGVVWDTPGHCPDHVSYYFAGERVIFTGDTLFAMGCGRILGSSAAHLYQSLQRFARLPEDVMVYCGHEYTLANARFCAAIEPDNAGIAKRLMEVQALRAAGAFTLPTSIGREKATNVFLRARDEAEFAARRAAKDKA